MRSIGNAIQSAFQWLFLFLWSALWISVALVASVFSPDVPLVLARRAWAPALVWVSRARLTVDPLPPLDPRGPYIFLMNHQSTVDIAIAFAHIPVNLRFIAKQVLRAVPLLGWYMIRTRMIFIDRGGHKAAVKSLKLAGDRIRAGASILAYVEGTRATTGEILPFKKGPFVIAIESGVPIVPVVVEGSGRVMPRNSYRMYPAPVRLRLGDPIPTAGWKHSQVEQLMRLVRDRMIDLHVAIGGRGGDRENAIALPGIEGAGRAARDGMRAAV
jgi:1-acyl-sn-glycerol-3-phosphate acyltransferase